MSAQDETGYNLITLASEVLLNSASLDDAAWTVAKVAMEPLGQAVKFIHKSRPDGLGSRRSLEPGVIVARWEDGLPVLGYIRFVCDISTSHVEIHPEVRVGSGAGVFVSPVSADSDDFKGRNPQFTSGDVVATARQFVQEQIDKEYPSVGGPMNIVSLKGGKIEWIT